MLQGILPVVRNDSKSAVVVRSGSVLWIMLCARPISPGKRPSLNFENKAVGFRYVTIH